MSTLLVYLGRKCTLPYISQDTISLRDVFVGGVTLGFFFSHPAITAQSLKLLFCERVGVEADNYYLTAALTVDSKMEASTNPRRAFFPTFSAASASWACTASVGSFGLRDWARFAFAAS